jgi:hypothetical protein
VLHMSDAELIVESDTQSEILRGRCSACRHTVFYLKVDSPQQRERLQELFDVHFQKIHAVAKK